MLATGCYLPEDNFWGGSSCSCQCYGEQEVPATQPELTAVSLALFLQGRRLRERSLFPCCGTRPWLCCSGGCKQQPPLWEQRGHDLEHQIQLP